MNGKIPPPQGEVVALLSAAHQWLVESDVDFCKQCDRIVPEGTEHDGEAHLAVAEKPETR